jgi:hypothetical protein
VWFIAFKCGARPFSESQVLGQTIEIEAGHAWFRRRNQSIECFRYNLIRPAHQSDFFRAFERYHLNPQVDLINTQGGHDTVLDFLGPAYPIDLCQKL